MNANRLYLPDGTGRAIKLTRAQASTLMSFQRSAYAKPIHEILMKVLDDSRIINETTPASEENRMRVLAAKDLLEILFTGKVELDEKT